MVRFFVPISKEELSEKVWIIATDEDNNFEPYNLLGYIRKDIKVDFSTENFYYEKEKFIKFDLGINILDNGLTCWIMRSGGDWEAPVYFIVYWDGKNIRGYVPKDGNPWNTDTKQAYGNDEESDLINCKKRYGRVPEDGDVSSWVDFDEDLIIKDIKNRILRKI